MTDSQWNQLLAILDGEIVSPMPMGFIIDCPWLPGWAGMNIADYLTSDELWFEANRRAIEAFPEFMFLPMSTTMPLPTTWPASEVAAARGINHHPVVIGFSFPVFTTYFAGITGIGRRTSTAGL
jgi:hypothetical protein